MKKFIIMFILGFSLISTSAFAGGIDANNNLSAEYIRSLTRNGSTDAIDIIYYNPAGLTFMKPGIYVNFSNQSLIKEYSHEATFMGNSTLYKDNDPILIFPSFYTAYIQKNWAVFGSFNVPGGGGVVNYKDGTVTTGDYPVKGSSIYYAFTFGGAYKLNKMFSFSLGVRTILGTYNVQTELTNGYPPAYQPGDILEYEREAKGFGGILGVNIRPMEKLNIGIRYETVTKLEWEYTKSNSVSPALAPMVDSKMNRDLPSILGLGVSYKVLPKLKTEFAFTYYFNTQADFDTDSLTGDATNGYSVVSESPDNGFETSISFEYEINDMIKASLGFLYTSAGVKKGEYSLYKPALDAFSVGAGVNIKPLKDLEINVGVMNITYFEEEQTANVYDPGSGTVIPFDLKLNKSNFVISLGAQYKF
jgi:long-chain fatty acid transport protein